MGPWEALAALGLLPAELTGWFDQLLSTLTFFMYLGLAVATWNVRGRCAPKASWAQVDKRVGSTLFK